MNTIESLNKINDTFIGVILNNFDYQAAYGSYYKYYYYYYGSEKGKEQKAKETDTSKMVPPPKQYS